MFIMCYDLFGYNASLGTFLTIDFFLTPKNAPLPHAYNQKDNLTDYYAYCYTMFISSWYVHDVEISFAVKLFYFWNYN